MWTETIQKRAGDEAFEEEVRNREEGVCEKEGNGIGAHEDEAGAPRVGGW